ncbi:MAG: metallophosphoesterase [Gemmatimonadota bacterium]|nr:MAG: metallophosphoesterase [Gemmatimonadota bacterium]
MIGSIVHLSDTHFGGEADLSMIVAIENLIPDLEPTATVVSGDLTVRARHGELQAAAAFVRELERTAPVVVIPGNHDVQWWWRPLLPFSAALKYRKYCTYFGPDATPTLSLPEVFIASAVTAHGVAWGSLTLQPRDIAVKGHLPANEIQRVAELFHQADPAQLRVLVLHHNVLPGELSRRMGLARWKRAQQRIVESGAELVLCGHDHQESIGQLGDKVVVSCTGTCSTRSRGDRPSVFHKIGWDAESIQIEQYRWDGERRRFIRADVYVFARQSEVHAARVSARAS